MAADLVHASTGNIGFLSVLQEPGGYTGGYLVTNGWGRPLEFRLTNAVQPNRIQQVLYGETLQAYMSGELIGKALVDKTATPVEWIVTDNAFVLDLRLRQEIPVALWHAVGVEAPGLTVGPQLQCHTRYPGDIAAIRSRLEKIGALDLGEPFARIREALTEARKMGVASRAA